MKELSDVENKTTDESKDEETEMLTIKDANSDKNRFKKYQEVASTKKKSEHELELARNRLKSLSSSSSLLETG